MSAPEFVPVKAGRREKNYESPPRRPQPWLAERPAEIYRDGQPDGEALGVQGPDQGYALRLANRLRDELKLTAGESANDAVKGCLGIALRRASLYGRAPMIHDLRLAFNLFGFRHDDTDPELVALRKPLFAEVASPHHYFEAREIATMVPESTLRLSHTEVEARRRDWRTLLGR
jgi:hypothetical protein